MASKKKQDQDLSESANEIFLAGLGALSRAGEEGSKLFEELVKRGRNYQGTGTEQLGGMLAEVRTRLAGLRERAREAQERADASAGADWAAVSEQADRALHGLDTVMGSVEERVEKTMASALRRIGVPTREEYEALHRTLVELNRSLDGLRGQQESQGVQPDDIRVRPARGDWHEILVHGVVVDRVRGEKAATARVEQLRRQNSQGGSGPGEITVEATGGGWYEVKVDGIAVDKVQGRRAAEAAVMRIEQQV